MDRWEALDWFLRRRSMALSDRCQDAEDVAIEAIETVINQDPKVLTVEELIAVKSKAVWLETRNGKVYTGWVLVYDHIKSGLVPGDRIGLTQPSGRVSWLLHKQYGKTWRCWGSEPTNEQRKAVKWDDQ